MTKDDEKFYFIKLNLLKDKHLDLIEWIRKEADENEQSLSSFCILVLKKYMEAEKENA